MVLARKEVSIGYFNGKSVSISEAIENAAEFMSAADTPQTPTSKLLDGFLALTDSIIRLIESADTLQPEGNSTRNIAIQAPFLTH